MVEQNKKPTIAELEGLMGTPEQPEIMPDGSIQPKEGRPRIPGDVDFKTACFAIRGYLEAAGISILNLKKHEALAYVNLPPINHKDEMLANIMLAYRHLEDARMRLGKAIQAYDGGESCYPR